VPANRITQRLNSMARTASEIVAEEVRTQIATGALKPGDMLPSESVLLDRYQVARPTVRGALRILESDGLVTVERGTNGGARVAGTDISRLARRVGLHLQLRRTNVRELIEAQALIQAGAAALAASARTRSDLGRLRSAVAVANSAQTIDELLVAGSAFVEALVNAAHNRSLSLYSELTDALLREGLDAYMATYPQSIARITGAMFRSAREFAVVVDLIEERDAEGAEEVWRAHLSREGALPHRRTKQLKIYGSSSQ
jgi:GntR family transcriptional regulator, transcriptional repressor for pyruvate dehydrogenase complex